MTLQVHGLFPYLRVSNATAAIAFYEVAFAAVEEFRLVEPNGRVGHAQLKLGAFTFMLSDEYPEFGIRCPTAFGGTGTTLHLHVDDTDEWTNRAVAAGATLLMPPTDQFYGERAATIRDPFGHEWLLGSRIEDVSPVEMQRRFTAMCNGT